MLNDILNALKVGEELKNAIDIKKYQAASNSFAALFIAVTGVAETFGYNIPVGHETIQQVAGAGGLALTVFNVFATVTTSKKIGM